MKGNPCVVACYLQKKNCYLLGEVNENIVNPNTMVTYSHFNGIVGGYVHCIRVCNSAQLISSESTPTEACGASLRGR